jgi:hypothetical protein
MAVDRNDSVHVVHEIFHHTGICNGS